MWFIFHLSLDVHVSGPLPRERVRWAVYDGPTELKQMAMPASGAASLDFQPVVTPSERVGRRYDLQIGFDINGNSVLESAEWSTTVELPHIQAFSAAEYTAAHAEITDYVEGWVYASAAYYLLPTAHTLLKSFVDGNTLELDPDRRPRTITATSFDYAEHVFANWLTHNAEAKFAPTRIAEIEHRSWTADSRLSGYVAESDAIVNDICAILKQHQAEIASASGEKILGPWTSIVPEASPVPTPVATSVPKPVPTRIPHRYEPDCAPHPEPGVLPCPAANASPDYRSSLALGFARHHLGRVRSFLQLAI